MYIPKQTIARANMDCSNADCPAVVPPYTLTNKIKAATVAAIMNIARFPSTISSAQMIINTTVPGVRLPIIASFILAMMMLIIEQKRKRFFIFCR